MTKQPTFNDFDLLPEILSALEALGYTHPTPIQAKMLPILMQEDDAKVDVVGIAQTGTGKTAAFALPILHNLSLDLKAPQALVLAPTRELATQVAEEFKLYAKQMKGFRALAIYGGQSYTIQTNALEKGVHVIVATPGRFMDLIDKKKIDLKNITTLVLDEADRMLDMGFEEDVETILKKLQGPQIALFSATLPPEILKIVNKYLKDPIKVQIESKTSTVSTISQYAIIVSNHHKLDAVTRLLEVDESDGMIIFVKTKKASEDLASRLLTLGYSAAAINGDLKQNARERVLREVKSGVLNILVATEVAARGLDVPRLSHVINYDIPSDPESYVHRIGRTGRAGRTGKSYLLITPNEQRNLKDIERMTKQPIEIIPVPSAEEVQLKRTEKLTDDLLAHIDSPKVAGFEKWIGKVIKQTGQTAEHIAATLALILQKDHPQLEDIRSASFSSESDSTRKRRSSSNDRPRSFDRKPAGRSFDRKPAERSFDRKPSERSFDRKPAERSFDRKSSERSFGKEGHGKDNFKTRSRIDAKTERPTGGFKSQFGAPKARGEDRPREFERDSKPSFDKKSSTFSRDSKGSVGKKPFSKSSAPRPGSAKPAGSERSSAPAKKKEPLHKQRRPS